MQLAERGQLVDRVHRQTCSAGCRTSVVGGVYGCIAIGTSARVGRTGARLWPGISSIARSADCVPIGVVGGVRGYIASGTSARVGRASA